MLQIVSGVLFLLLLPVGLSAQTKLSGQVTDPQTNPIAGRVSLYPPGALTPLIATTDNQGVYRFENLAAGAYTVEVEAASFRRISRTLRIEKDQREATENFEMAIAGLTQTVVVTATGEAQTIDQTAKAISVITSEEINDRNEYNLAEILRNVPGLQVRNLGGPGALTQIRMRGLRPDASAVLVDGMRFRDPTTTQGDATSFMANLTFVNAGRVEVLRGSGSSLYGSNAVGGAINMVSDEGGAPVHGMIQAEGGGLGFLRGRASLAGGFRENRWTYSLGFTHLNVMAGVDGNDANRSNGGQGFLRYSLSDRTRVSGRFYGAKDFLQSNITPATTGIPAGNFPTTGVIPFIPLPQAQVRNLVTGQPVSHGNATVVPGRDDPDNRRESAFSTSAVRLEHQFTTKVNMQANYQYLTTNRIFSNGPGGIGFQPAATNVTNPGGYIHTLDWRVNAQVARWYSLSGGYEFEREFFNDRQNNNLPAPRTIVVSGRIRQNSNAVFVANQLSLFKERLLISLSGRMQDFRLATPVFQAQGVRNVYDGLQIPNPPRAWTGDVSIAYLLASTGTKLRTHIGNAYRAPALYERFGGGFFNNPATGNVNFTPYGDPRLSPDRYNTYDFGIDQYLWQSRIRLSATYFYNRIKQLTAFDSAGRITAATDPFGRTSGYLNGAGGISRGVEFGYEARLTRSTTMQGSYTFTNAVSDRDIQVPNFWFALTTPRHTASFVVTQRIGKRADLTFDLFRGGQYYVPFFAVNRTRAFLSPGYTKGDVVGGYKLWSGDKRNVRLYGKVENVFNQLWYENGWLVPQAWGIVGLSFSY
ncbi:MAG: TonB-dependent receptor plug domain-containing protein [Acidobacteriota bacterium]